MKYNFLPENLFTVENEEILSINLFGKSIKNPIGLAAGFDKSAEVYNQMFKLGFGFVKLVQLLLKNNMEIQNLEFSG